MNEKDELRVSIPYWFDTNDEHVREFHTESHRLAKSIGLFWMRLRF